MFGSEILEVAIGLFFVYLILSLISSTIREAIESFTKSRGTDLARGIELLLQNPKLTAAVYNHPLVGGLYKENFEPPPDTFSLFPRRSKLPSYIPSGNFALALLDIVARGSDYDDPDGAGPDAPPLSLANVRHSIGSIPDPRVRRAILAAVDRADGDFSRAQANLEAWYNSGMDRVSGWYKRRTQFYLLLLGLGMAMVLNVNTIAVAEHLYRDDDVREALVARVEGITARPDSTGASRADSLMNASLGALTAQLDSLSLPIGWKSGWPGVRVRHPEARPHQIAWWWEQVLGPVFGWLLTAFAVSLGAPFWFDMMNKVMVIRSTVKPHEKSGEEGSEDRKSGSPPPHLGGQPALQLAAPGFGAGEGGQIADPAIVQLPPGMVAAGGFEPQEWDGGDPEEGVL